MLTSFKLSTLYAPQKGTWRIEWYNYHPYSKKLERIQKTFDLNRIKNKRERRYVASEYIRLINIALKQGYNYFTDTENIGSTSNTSEITVISIKQLLLDMLPQRIQGLKERTQKTYRSYNNKLIEWLDNNGYADLSSRKFEYAIWLEFVNHKLNLGHSARNINHFTEYFKTTFDLAIKIGWMKRNPLDLYERLKEKDSTVFNAFTSKELSTIKNTLIENNIHFYIYTKFVALEFIRPYHLAFIKARDIDYANDLIMINAESSKNSKVKQKQLLPQLKEILIKHKYDQLPDDYYIFSKSFLPNKRQYKSLSIRAAEYWKKVVIDGLGIDKKMYALKHTSSQYYLNNNSEIDCAWLQHQMEHSSLAETETYISKRQIKKIDTDNTSFIDY